MLLGGRRLLSRPRAMSGLLVGQLWKERFAAPNVLSPDEALQWFADWKLSTKNRPLPQDFGAAILSTCLRGGFVQSAVEMIALQPAASCTALVHEAATHLLSPRVSVAHPAEALQGLLPLLDALNATEQGSPLFGAVLGLCLSLVANIPGKDQGCAAAAAVVETALQVSATPRLPHAAVLLYSLCCAVNDSSPRVPRVFSVVDVAVLNSKAYVPAAALVAVLRLASKRKDTDEAIVGWWKWMKHTRVSTSVEGLSLVLLALCRTRPSGEANEITQQLCAMNVAPTAESQLAFLDSLLQKKQKKPVAQAKFLVDWWSARTVGLPNHRVALLEKLLLMHDDTTGAGRDIVVELLQPTNASSLSVECLLVILRVTGSSRRPAEDRELLVNAVHAVLARTETTAELIARSAIAATQCEMLDVFCDWVAAMSPSDDIFNEALRIIVGVKGEAGIATVVGLCEVAHRSVPDELAGWVLLAQADDTAALNHSNEEVTSGN